jgi:hypothetical protein
MSDDYADLLDAYRDQEKRIAELERDRDHGPMTGARAIDQQRRRADKAERELAEEIDAKSEYAGNYADAANQRDKAERKLAEALLEIARLNDEAEGMCDDAAALGKEASDE